jgi:hypothetical protein
VGADGTKELVAVADGERESTDSWAELLRDLRRRGMRAPVVAVGDGALGLWAALGEVFPATRHHLGTRRGTQVEANVIVGRKAGKRGPCAAQGLPHVSLVDTTARQPASVP